MNKLRKNFRLSPRIAALLEKEARANGWTETRVVEQLILSNCVLKKN